MPDAGCRFTGYGLVRRTVADSATLRIGPQAEAERESKSAGAAGPLAGDQEEWIRNQEAPGSGDR